jgi:short-subunit dehydrogenase
MTTALITGASSGIGAVFAEQLASRKYALVLVARSQDKLTAIADRLQQQHSIRVTVIVQDLTVPNAAEAVCQQLEQQGIIIDWLINNAGFGHYGEFVNGDLSNYLAMIQLNVTALVELTYLILQGMRQRRSGSIINIASTAAFQALPYFGVYAATKAFVLSFSESLWYEGKPLGIRVLGVCPGPTATEFFKVADFPEGMKESISQNYTSPEVVVAEALAALEQGRSNVVPGVLMNQLMVNSARFLPREVLTNAVGRLFQG